MNQWQAVHQLQWLLARAVWPSGTGDPLFRRVLVISGPDDPGLSDVSTPFACIHPGPVTADEEEPGLVEASFSVVTIQSGEGQNRSQAATLGSNRGGGVGSSKGRGVMELEEEVIQTVGRLTGVNGARAAVAFTSGPSSAEVGSAKWVVAKEISVKVWCTAARHYDAPIWLVATPNGAGRIDLTWRNPPTRWDQYPGTDHDGTRLAPIIRYAVGATAPATATDGTGVTGIASGGTSVSATSLSAGATSFSIWQPYSEAGGVSPERYSSQELSTYATATVS